MSTGLEKLMRQNSDFGSVFPKYAFPSPGYKIPDIDKRDKTLTRLFHMIFRVQNDIGTAATDWLGLLLTIPTYNVWMELLDINSLAAYDAFIVANPALAPLDAVCDYMDTPKNTVLPAVAVFPPCFSFLFTMDVEEKRALFKSSWRTRSQHAVVVRLIQVMNFVILMGMAVIYAVWNSKFRIVGAQVYPDTFQTIVFNQWNPSTFVAQHYAEAFAGALNVDTIYAAYATTHVTEQVFIRWDAHKFVIPEESVKIGKLLCGYFLNFNVSGKGGIKYDYPCDFLFIPDEFDNNILGTDLATYIDTLNNVNDIVKQGYLISERIEYGDRFYGSELYEAKKQMRYLDLNSELLKKWEKMYIPWPHIFISFHHQLAGNDEVIFRDWSQAHGDNKLDLSVTNIFTREEPEEISDAAPAQYLNAFIPYSYNEEEWEIAMVFGWILLLDFMNDANPLNTLALPSEVQDVTVANSVSIVSQTTFLDKDDKNLGEQYVAAGAPVENDLCGWVVVSDDIANGFADMYKPQVLAGGAYPILDIDEIQAVSDGAGNLVPDATEVAQYREKMRRQLPMVRNSLGSYTDSWMKEQLTKIFNPLITSKVSNNPADGEKSTKVNTDEKDQVGKSVIKDEPANTSTHNSTNIPGGDIGKTANEKPSSDHQGVPPNQLTDKGDSKVTNVVKNTDLESDSDNDNVTGLEKMKQKKEIKNAGPLTDVKTED